MENKRAFNLIFLLLTFVLVISIAMADTPKQEENPKREEQATAGSEGSVQIVYMERTSDEDPESTHIQTLASVLGSEEAAKNAILYSYKHTTNGFSAKLTPEQVDALSKLPGVLQVLPSRTYHLHDGAAGLSTLT